MAAPARLPPRCRPGAHDVLQQTLLRRYAPVSFLVDEHLELHGVEGPVGRYQPYPVCSDDPTGSLLACSELRDQLQTAIRRADVDRRKVVAGASLPSEHGEKKIRLQVAPLAGADDSRGLFLVSLLEPEAADEADPVSDGPAPAVLDLAAELAAANDYSASLGCQLSLAREKHRALEEELFQIDDECRAACDELKTAQARLEAENLELQETNRTLRDQVRTMECQADDLDNLLTATDVATLFLGIDLCIRWYTPAMRALIPLRPWDLGRHADQLSPRFSGRDLASDAAAVLASLEPSVTEVRGANGQWYIRRILPYRTRDDHIDGLAVTFVDITERKRSEDEIIHQATHDSLTDLPNRATFHRELALARERASATNGRLAVLMLDLDRFKRVNDSYGHALGDRLLVEIAGRIRSCARPGDLVARLGGDEFALLIRDVHHHADVQAFVETVLQQLAAPCRFGTIELRPRASIGVTVFPEDAGDCDQLVSHADRALYLAKESRRRGWAIFDCDMRLAEELPSALERDEFDLAYQPIVALDSASVFGFEALLRWDHPVQGHLLPHRFLPLAERHGLMPAITDWVLDHACRQLALWRSRGLDPGILTVNVTDEFLLKADVLSVLDEVLGRHKIKPGDLVLEIHERTLLESVDDALLPVLERLSARGFGIALDDFGVGHASLIHLRLKAVGIVKIDREFLRDQTASKNNMTIVAAMADLCRRLDKTIIVEGIETRAQQMQVKTSGCQWGQGYWHARPMTATAMTLRLLRVRQSSSM